MKRMRKFMAFLIATIMMASNIAPAFAAMTGDEEMPPGEVEDYTCPNLAGSNLPVVPVKPEDGKTAKDLVKNPDQPAIYTLRTDYKVEREGDFVINYQPYIASVGEAATEEEKAKIRKTISVPEFSGYFTPKDADENEVQDYTIDYNTIVGKAKTGKESGDEEVGRKFEANQEFRYYGKTKEITVKHKFQDIKNLNNYTNLGGEEDKNEITTTQEGKTSSILEIKPLDEEEIKGFVPEENIIKIQVPNNTEDFVVEYRYNRAQFNINFDTDGGTELPSRTLYYGQTIPKLNFGVTKVGATLNGWKVSKDITYGENGEHNLSKDDLITEADFEEGGRFANGIRYAMPAEDLTFTADWNEKEKASYVIQFWTEKTDYDDTNDALALRDRYDFIGARRVDNADTGSRPELTNLDIHGITFPDLNEGRLEKAQDDKEEFERYYFLNEDLTQKQNASKKDPEVQKSVSSTGETVYNVYYDRRVYTLYFTAANEEAFDLVGSFWPIITREGQVIGKEGSPYKVDVRFNQSLDKIWPKDEEVSNLPPASSEKGVDIGLIGWIINNNAGEQIYRDTPPYRLSAEDFIDAEDVMSEEDYYGYGHADQIPIKDGKTKKRDKYEISIGSTSYEKSVVHHIDIIKDDFDGKEQIDYDMSYWKSDTNAIGADGYPFILPHLQGFTLKQEEREAEWILEKPTDNQYRTINDLNGDRNKKTPFRSDADKIEYIDKFPWGTKSFEGRNAYNYANYTRNKYKLKLNNDPKTVKNDSEYGEGNILDVPYELPLNDLKLDTTHKPQKPNWVRDDWSFLGWALDPAGDNLVKDGNETKLHYDQILYAKWGEPDYKWKVTIDPNEGQLGSISAKELTIDTKKIKEGDVGQEIEVTYPQKESSDGDKQVFTVLNRQKLNELPKPRRKGYDFLGWEVIHYIKNDKGEYTDEIDTSYHELYRVPELYTFGNEVVAPVYLKAIWVPNKMVDVKVEHYFLDDGFNLDGNIDTNPAEETLEGKRAEQMVSATATKQDEKYLLASHEELTEKLKDPLKEEYQDYNKRVNGLNNSFYQNLRVEPEEITNEDGEIVENPDAKNNVFKFFYRPIRTREYKVNYIDESYKGSKNEKDGAIIPQEKVVNGNRHYDARNYKKIPGWVLTSDPQQQLFFNIDEDTNELIGINGTNSDEITFYYKDVRIIEVPGDDPVPDDYVRVTFKADEGGTFVDKDGNEVKEIHYDVIKGLPFGKIPRPDSKNANELKIVPEEKYSFLDWERDKPKEKGLLEDTQCVNRSYTFTAKFEQAKGKLTVKKVFENEPVDKETTKMKKAPKKEDPIEFEFTITGPNKFEKTFTLKAGEEKTFEGLAYGDYTVEEIDSKDYTAYYFEGDYNKESSDLSDKPIKISLEKSEDVKTYTKSLTVVNKNIKPDPDKTNENIIDVEVKKIWDGGTKPATTIELWREGQGLDGKTFNEKVKEVEDFTTKPGGEDKQSYTFKGLPKHDPSGREFVYYAMEVTILENYEASYSDDDRLTITNTYTSPQTDEDVIGEKIWKNVPDGKKIPTVKLELWRKIKDSDKEEKVVEASDLDSENQVNFGKQAKTDKDGQDYIYFVKEVDGEGNPFEDENYTPKTDVLTITNIYRDKIPDTQDIKATKIWKGNLEEKEELPTIYFKLYRKSASKEAQAVGDIMKIAPGTEIVTWKDMDIADEEGNKYEYFVKEVDEKGKDFTPEGYSKEEKGLTVTNTKKSQPVEPEKTLTVKAIKTWQGGPESDHGQVNLLLLRKSSKTSEYENVDVSYTILEDGRTYLWENLAVKDEEDYLYTYKVLELGIDENNNFYVGDNKYLSTVEKDERNSTEDTLVFDLVNTYQEPQDPNQIIAYKKWLDLPSGEIPPRVFFILQRNIAGEAPYDVEEQILEVGNIANQDGFIEVDFGEQEEFDEDGNPYIYSIREVDIEGNPFNNPDYISTAEGLYAVNKYKTKDPDPVPVPDPEPEPSPDPTPDPKPEPDPIIPGDDDTPQTPDKPDKPEEPEIPEEPGKPEVPERPESPENPKPEKPKENIPENPEKEKPPVKTENNKTNQTGTKIVKTINQTGTKIVRNVKNFLNPSTGIIKNYEIYIGLMAASSVGLFFTREKKNKDED